MLSPLYPFRAAARTDSRAEAYAHKDAQPVSLLPNELIFQIFDDLSHSFKEGDLPPNFPQALAVFHLWRVIGIAYPKLWSHITIILIGNYVGFEGFGHFVGRPTPTRIHRLTEHLTRSKTSLIRLSIQRLSRSSPSDLNQYIALLYPHSSRFETLDAVGRNTVSESIFPLPRNLGNLRFLRFYGWDGPQSLQHGTLKSKPFLDGQSCFSPIALTLPSLSQPFHLIGTERPESRVMSASGTLDDLKSFYTFIQRAQSIRVFTSLYAPVPALYVGDDTFEPISVPGLKSIMGDNRSLVHV